MTDKNPSERAKLRDLARAHRIQIAYTAADGRRRFAKDQSLRAVLASLNVPANTPEDVEQSLANIRQHLAQTFLEDVVVIWIDPNPTRKQHPHAATIRIPNDANLNSTVHAKIKLENEQTHQWSVDPSTLRGRRKKDRAGNLMRHLNLPIPHKLPIGYHTLTVTINKQSATAKLIVAPPQTYAPDHWTTRPAIDGWGLFAPTYALRSSNDPGCGNLTELRRLAEWSADRGASAIATLPLTAVYLDEPFLPGPYSPVSRLFWNELYVDPIALPQAASSPSLDNVLRAASHTRETESLRAAEIIQYRRQAKLNRQALQAVADDFFNANAHKAETFQRFLDNNPEATTYAQFRAVTDRRRTAWNDWPARLRNAKVKPEDYDNKDYNYHLFAQFAAAQQLNDLKQALEQRDMRLYLDLPVGVHRHGYDTWSRQHLWVAGASVGAPPDPYFPLGQDWGFPPMHPEACRKEHHQYFINAIRNQLQYAGYMRLDHVMAFDRLFWIPDGLPAAEGVYVNYEAEDFYAILAIESHREQCILVGENIGTVPEAVVQRMNRTAIGTLYIGQFAGQAKGERAITPVHPGAVASLNTHDMPPFALYWSGDDVDERIQLGIFQERFRNTELHHLNTIKPRILDFLKQRGLIEPDATIEDVETIRDAFLRYIAGSQAQLMLVNIEDLWLERRWQNIPSTHDEYPNWRHKLRIPLDTVEQDPEIEQLLKQINELRNKAAVRNGPVPESA